MPVVSCEKRRRSITNAQRRALRAWYFDDTMSGNKTHLDASAWWQETYGYRLNSSSISEILSYKYAPLDDVADLDAGPHANRRRDRAAKWEQLEEELIKWVRSHEEAGTHISGSMLRKKASELWLQLPCYRGQPCPKWSDGWKARFQARYDMHSHRPSSHDDGGSSTAE